MEEYDVIIVGAGPGGLTAGIYAGRQNLRTLILDKDLAGGQAREVPIIDNFPGSSMANGLNLIKDTIKQTEKYASIHEFEEVQHIINEGNQFHIKTSKDEYISKTIIITSGSYHRRLDVPGEKNHVGRGVSYCATCDGLFFKGKNVAVVGGGNTAAISAIYLNNLGCNVSLIHRRDKLRCQHYLEDQLKELNINIIWNTNVKEIEGEPFVNNIKLLSNDGTVSDMAVDGVFIAVGDIPSNSICDDLNVELDSSGYIITDKEQKTNVSNVYAAGDITGGLKQWIVACGEGAVAAMSAYNDLIREN